MGGVGGRSGKESWFDVSILLFKYSRSSSSVGDEGARIEKYLGSNNTERFPINPWQNV